MALEFDVISYADQRGHFLAALENAAGAEGLPRPTDFILTSDYYRAYFQDDFSDLSFCLESGGKIYAFVLFHKFGPDSCGYYGRGAFIYILEGHKNVPIAICETLLEKARHNGLTLIKIMDEKSTGVLSSLGMQAFNYDGVPSVNLYAVTDLMQSEEAIWSALRRRYRTMINRGQRELSWHHIDKDNPDPAVFQDFRDLHFEEAGRKTRSDESWDVQYEMIKQGCSDLGVGVLEGHGMVSAALYSDHGDTTIYATAVYKRDLFDDKPLAHNNIYQGMMRARARGIANFYMGQILPKGTVSDKEYNITRFKKGFCNNLQSCMQWKLPVKAIAKQDKEND